MVNKLGDIVGPTDRKAEALLVLQEDPEFIRFLVMFDGIENGGPIEYFCAALSGGDSSCPGRERSEAPLPSGYHFDLGFTRDRRLKARKSGKPDLHGPIAKVAKQDFTRGESPSYCPGSRIIARADARSLVRDTRATPTPNSIP